MKNNLQTISTLIGLQLRGLEDPVAVRALQSLHERVDALGTVHRRLNTNESIGEFDLSDLVRELVPKIVKGGARGDISVDIDVSSIKMHVSNVTPISLILNELVTNAARHAWNAGEAGNLKVRAHAGNRHVTITVSDDGKGTPAKTPPRSLSGLKLTEALVRKCAVPWFDGPRLQARHWK